MVLMSDTIKEPVDAPEFTEADIENVTPSETQTVPLIELDKRRGVFERFIHWQPGKTYKLALGVLSVATTIFAVQNLPQLQKWEDWHSDNFYPSPPPGCQGYVDYSRDLAHELPKLEDSSDVRVISSLTLAKELQDEGEAFIFQPNVTNVQSSSENFDSGGVRLQETLQQARSFFDHHIESFSLRSGLIINVYSTTDNPGFSIDHERFNELALATFDDNLVMADQHYQELLNCTQKAFGLPGTSVGGSLDVFILPETGFCIGHLRYFEIADGATDEGCVSQGATPPELNAKFLWWDLFEENFMLLTFKDAATDEELTLSINRILAHEFAHYWNNQTGRDFELNPEERQIKAMDQSMIALNIADLQDPTQPAIIFETHG
jgi:hypothetical protein